jgi:demethylmenaquinone methyltransferase / 2-methoxy-6-polyprenyl-1,4-benzoquinol methylase
MTTDDRETVAFGYRRVPAAQKQDLVKDVFAQVARRYDQMNDLMSAGLHRLWKDDFVSMLAPPRGSRAWEVLDVAGGTGDIAARILREAGVGTHVCLTDISSDMLRLGAERARREGFGRRCSFVVGDAQALPFAAGRFEAYTVAFGIRNVTHIERALAEAHRVLRPGGRFLCLEFSHVDVPGLAQLYEAYSFTAIPALGKVVTGDGAPYRYLVESIRTFPDAERFAELIQAAGFGRVTCRKLSGGIVAIHSGWRI